MSNTRKAAPGAPMKQNKFSSSVEFETGLLGNLVARRCSLLERPEDRELIWFLQYLSHQEGGLKKLSETILEKFGDRIGTERMRKIGKRPGQKYTADEVKLARLHIPTTVFQLQGEISAVDEILIPDNDSGNQLARLKREAGARPNSYPVADFFEACRRPAHELEDELKKLCLDPSEEMECGPWWFHELIDCLREYHTEYIEAQRQATITTELGQMLHDELDYALETKCMVLVEGLARMGKTFSAKAWCAQRPGRARYVQVPSTNDEIGFFRALAKAIGVSHGLGWKAVQLRERIEDALQSGDLILVLDEAHYCWPVTDYRYALPGRINWIMTALVNKNVPVALITTPQFIKTQKIVEARTAWTSEQFTGRLGHYLKLPDSLSEDDLSKVASSLLPEGDAISIEILVRYAQSSAKYLAGIDAVVRRARYLAKKEQRSKVTRSDIKLAVQESAIPSDSALAMALEGQGTRRQGRPTKAPLNPVYASLNDRAVRSETDLLDEQSSAPTRPPARPLETEGRAASEDAAAASAHNNRLTSRRETAPLVTD